jgi:hypothetical protein
VSIFAGTSYAREYVDATDEHAGAETPPANAHVRERVRTYSPKIDAAFSSIEISKHGAVVVVCLYLWTSHCSEMSRTGVLILLSEHPVGNLARCQLK